MPLVPRHIQDLVAYKPGKSINSLKREIKDKHIIKLASNENSLGPSKLALESIKNDLTNFRQKLENAQIADVDHETDDI